MIIFDSFTIFLTHPWHVNNFSLLLWPKSFLYSISFTHTGTLLARPEFWGCSTISWNCCRVSTSRYGQHLAFEVSNRQSLQGSENLKKFKNSKYKKKFKLIRNLSRVFCSRFFPHPVSNFFESWPSSFVPPGHLFTSKPKGVNFNFVEVFQSSNSSIIVLLIDSGHNKPTLEQWPHVHRVTSHQ